MKKYAIIVAAGSGLRMGTQMPKQFLPLGNRPVLWHTLNTFLDAYDDMEIILVLPEEYSQTGMAIVASSAAPHRIRAVPGGGTRFHSVKNGLLAVEDESILFVHDGVRCLLTKTLVHHCYEQAVQFGSAIPVVESVDSVRIITDEGNEAIERWRVKLVQTPQTFLSTILLPAYDVEYRERFTDEASVVEASGHTLHLVEGEINNIKITTMADLAAAEKLLSKTN